MDDDDEDDNLDLNNKDNKNYPLPNKITTADIYLKTSKEKTNNNNNNDNDKKDTILKNDGSKFTLIIPNENNANNNDNIDNVVSKKNNNKDKDKEKDNYDLICINNISKILAQVEEKLKKDNPEKRDDDKCYEMIGRIKSNNTDLKKRKRNTYCYFS